MRSVNGIAVHAGALARAIETIAMFDQVSDAKASTIALRMIECGELRLSGSSYVHAKKA